MNGTDTLAQPPAPVSAAGKAGFTATAVCSVTADPPTLLVCVNVTSSVGQIFIGNPSLALNAVSAEQSDLAMLFGGKTPLEDRFAAADLTSGQTGAPVLTGANAAFECVVGQSQRVGTHQVLFCEVIGTRVSDVEVDPGVYLGRGFRRFPAV